MYKAKLLNSKKQVSAIEQSNKCLEKQESLLDEEGEEIARKAIITLPTKRNQVTAAQNKNDPEGKNAVMQRNVQLFCREKKGSEQAIPAMECRNNL
eukprot:7046439-Ditylum_brightwellii.AAC.1